MFPLLPDGSPDGHDLSQAVGPTVVTGGAGFMGSHVTAALAAAGCAVTVLDRFTYAGHMEHLSGVDCRVVRGDVCDPQVVARALDGARTVVHLAAESHVARALHDPGVFVRTNVEGTRVMLDEARKAGVTRFLHVSTDEVFGQVPDGTECTPDQVHAPGNAYAASKVGAEAMVSAWRHTWDFPAAVVRCTNNYGPRQHPEKAVPSWALAALEGGPVPVHGDGSAVRDWLHVDDFVAGVLAILTRWRPGAVWHLAGQQHLPNRQMAAEVIAAVAGHAGRPLAEIAWQAERQGQDRRYALDDTATRAELDWAPRVDRERALAALVAWYAAHGALWAS